MVYSIITKAPREIPYKGSIPKIVFKNAAKSTTFIIRQKPLMEGRLELLNYFQEQSISHSYHRYGNISSK